MQKFPAPRWGRHGRVWSPPFDKLTVRRCSPSLSGVEGRAPSEGEGQRLCGLPAGSLNAYIARSGRRGDYAPPMNSQV